MENRFRRHIGFARSACVTLAAILVACADDITRPREGVQRTLQPPATFDVAEPSNPPKPKVPKAADPDIVLMERTTDIAADKGREATHRKLKKKLVGQVRLGKGESDDGKGAEHKFDLENLPQPPISLPAAFRNSTCAAAPGWKKALPGSAGGSGEVEVSGFGDAPASTIRHVQDGKTLFTVERTWVRTRDKWQLERQVTTTPDGKYRDVVTYKHVTTAGNPVKNAIPTTACVTSLTGTPRIAAGRGLLDGLGSSTLTTAASNLTDECGSSFDFGSDPCFEKRDNVYRADAALVAAATVMTYACMVANPVKAATCLPAVTAYSVALANLKFAQRALVNCLKESQGTTCNCGPGLAVSTGTEASSRSLAGSISTGNPDIQVAGSYGYSVDPCGYDPAPYYPGGGGSGSTCQWMDWEISYDGGMTWEYLGTFWTCYAVDV